MQSMRRNAALAVRMYQRSGHDHNGIVGTERARLEPMEEASLQVLVVREPVDRAYGRNAESFDRQPIDYIGSIAMRMHDVRSDSSTKSSDRRSLGEVAAPANHDS
jgi:hypothetical protein